MLSGLWQSIYNHYWRCETALPTMLGVSNETLQKLIYRFELVKPPCHELDIHRHQNQTELRATLQELKQDEWLALKTLFLEHLNSNTEHGEPFCQVLASASLGNQHLWKDLGMNSRADLSTMIKIYLPTLHASNTNNMRWKRFFYLQLCQRDGDYICRAPSCDQCSSHSECFVV
ncbi:hypothetical protein BCU68_10725 [Vibrio sp. 10N.286.49.B3]|nr:hypothetical protein BCU68_10725 [Vibrio sp. 10N.286.49.B3]